MFSTYQIVQSVTFTMDVVYPSPFSDFLGLLSRFGFSLQGMECLGFGVYETVYILSLSPLATASVLVLLFLLRMLLAASSKEMRSRIAAQHAYMLLLLSYMVLPPISMIQLQSLDCFKFGHDGELFLRKDMEVNCGSDQHKTFEVVDGALIFMYLSIPLVWLILLRSSREQLMPRGIADERSIANMRSQNEKLASLRFLFDSYRAKMYQWVRLCTLPLSQHNRPFHSFFFNTFQHNRKHLKCTDGFFLSASCLSSRERT